MSIVEGWSECDACVFQKLRGWSVRAGSAKKLSEPKRGKAATLAASKNQGQEVLRGRSSFKRTVNDGSRRYVDKLSYKQAAQQTQARAKRYRRMLAVDDLADWCDCVFNEPCDGEFWTDEWFGDEEWLEWPAEEEVTHRVEVRVKELSPIEKELEQIAKVLVGPSKVVLDVKGLKVDSAFAALQRRFLKSHGSDICHALRANLHIAAASLSPEVQSRFVEACQGSSAMEGKLRPAFHGTHPKNLGSILRRGLLIPGQNNEVRVANGSAHGRGIYAAKVSPQGAELSRGFCRGGPMLLCGVLDDAVPVARFQCGIRSVTAESSNVRHVDDAMVVFDSRRVAPLFIASTGSKPFTTIPQAAYHDFDWHKRDEHVQRLAELYPAKEVRPTSFMRKLYLRGVAATKGKGVMVFLQRRAAQKRRPRLVA